VTSEQGRGATRWWVVGAGAAGLGLMLAASGGRPGAAIQSAQGTGPTADIVVRYPARFQRVSPDSNFLFGSVSGDNATLEINGVPVDVEANGGFLAWLEVPSAHGGDTAIYRLVARTATDTVVLEHPIRRPPSGPPVGAVSPWVDPDDLGLRAERWLRADEPITFEFVAESGTRLTLEAGARSFEIPVVEAVRGELDRYRVMVDASELREAACGGGACVRGTRSGVDGGRADETAPPALAVDTLGLRLVLDKAGVQRAAQLRIPLAVLGGPSLRGPGPGGPSQPLGPSVRLSEAPDPVNGLSGVVVGRTTPFGPYRWRFPEGTTVQVTGRLGDRLRVRVHAGLDAWVLAADASWASAISTPAVTWDARVSEAGVGGDTRPHLALVEDAVVLRVGVSRPVAAEAEITGPRSIALTLHDTYGRLDRIAHGVGTGVKSVRWTQAAGPSTRLELEFEWPVWGYRLSYETGEANAYEGARSSRLPGVAPGVGEQATVLRLDLRRAPRIDGSSPLVGRRIAVDPGHPGAGSRGPTGFFEGDANLAVARQLVELLERAGARPLLIRDDRAALGLYDRTRIAREGGAEIFVSIHNNALPDGIRPFERAGTSTYYYHPHAAGLGRAVQAAVVSRLGLRDLGLVWGDLAVAREPWMPAVLAEGAFMLIPEQEAALRTPEFQASYARGVLEGIESFLGAMADAPF